MGLEALTHRDFKRTYDVLLLKLGGGFKSIFFPKYICLVCTYYP